VERIYYYWCHGLFPAYSGLGRIDASKLPQLSTNINDRKLGAFVFGYLRGCEGLALLSYHE
jgi:hypothetical protein